MEKLKLFLVKCKRVWHVMRKPTKKEYNTIAKVAAIGILILGAMGFFISLLVKGFFK